MPDTYRSPHTGTIADLMGRRGMAGAAALQQAGDANARAALVSGQAWGNAIQNIGQNVSGTLQDFARQRSEAPERELRQRQSDLLAKQLAALDTEAATSKIGQLAQMVQASGYDPGTAEPIFRAIGTITPDYAEPLMRSLMDPAMLKKVTDTLVMQTPGYKAPEGFSLGEGQTRFGPGGEQIASVPKSEPVAPAFTLGEGQTRYGPDGQPIASGPPKPEPAVSLQRAEVLLDGKPAMVVFNPAKGTYSVGGQDVSARVKPIPPAGPAPERPSVWVQKGTDQRYVTPSEASSLVAQGWGPSQSRENPSEDERKSTGFYNQMKDAIRVMDEVEDAITPQDLYQIQSLPQKDLMGMVNRGKMSEPAKRYIRSLMQYTEARLRAVSGASVQPHEYEADRQMFGKQYGETPQLNTDRRTARGIVLEGLKTRGGRAMPKEDSEPAPTTGLVEAIDEQGNIHHAPAGTPLPKGWKLKGQ